MGGDGSRAGFRISRPDSLASCPLQTLEAKSSIPRGTFLVVPHELNHENLSLDEAAGLADCKEGQLEERIGQVDSRLLGLSWLTVEVV